MDSALEDIRSAIAEKQWHAAEQMASAALQRKASVEAARLLAESLAGQGKLNEAIAEMEKIAELEPDSRSYLSYLASLLWQAREVEKAAACCARLLELDPNDAEALNSMGVCRLAQERVDEAIHCFTRACALVPAAPALRHNLARALERAGRFEEAAKSYREEMRLKPDSVAALYALAQIYSRMANGDNGQAMLRRIESARSLQSRDAIGEAVVSAAEAVDFLRRALEIEPGKTEARSLLASILNEQGKHQEAISELETVLSANPKSAEPYWLLTRTRKIKQSDLGVIEKMRSMLSEADRRDEGKQLLHNALGKAYGDLGQYEDSMRHYGESHRLAQIISGITFDRKTHKAHIDGIIGMFTEEFFQTRRDIALDSSLPVFIVGMPRSGTTLVEQIISSHPRVYGGGEIPFWPDLAKDIYDPIKGSFDKAAALSCGNAYIRLLWQVGGDKLRVTDKNPFNYFHVGLLHALYPGTRFIHCRREPVDNCLSIYMAHFRFAKSYMHQKEDLVYAYREYARLMDHWRRSLPEDRFFDVDYEELVGDPKGTARNLIAFCQIPWHDSCLRPDKNTRIVRTASQWQVRQPVYSSSISRWKRYEPWLGAFADLLHPNNGSEGTRRDKNLSKE